MSAAEIIEQIKSLPLNDKEQVRRYLNDNLAAEQQSRLYDDFTVLGLDSEGSDVTYAEPAQAEIIRS